MQTLQKQVEQIQQNFADQLPDLLQQYTADYHSKLVNFINNSITAYSKLTSYPITVLTYLMLNGKNGNQGYLNDICLLSHLVQFQARLNFEQQNHSQGSLRKVVTDDYIYPLQQFLSLAIPQISGKVIRQSGNKHVLECVQNYYQLSTQILFEAARFKEQKEIDYQLVQKFDLYNSGLFHIQLAFSAEQYKEFTENIQLFTTFAQILKYKQNFNAIDTIQYIKEYSKQTPECDAYQQLLLNKFDTGKLAEIIAVYNFDLKVQECQNDLVVKFKDQLLQNDSKYEWMVGYMAI